MMNINKILDEIIFRYQIDRYFPHYRKMKEAEEVLDALMLDVVEQKKNVIFVGKDQNEIALLKYLIKERNISVFLFKDDASCLENSL